MSRIRPLFVYRILQLTMTEWTKDAISLLSSQSVVERKLQRVYEANRGNAGNLEHTNRTYFASYLIPIMIDSSSADEITTWSVRWISLVSVKQPGKSQKRIQGDWSLQQSVFSFSENPLGGSAMRRGQRFVFHFKWFKKKVHLSEKNVGRHENIFMDFEKKTEIFSQNHGKWKEISSFRCKIPTFFACGGLKSNKRWIIYFKSVVLAKKCFHFTKTKKHWKRMIHRVVFSHHKLCRNLILFLRVDMARLRFWAELLTIKIPIPVVTIFYKSLSSTVSGRRIETSWTLSSRRSRVLGISVRIPCTQHSFLCFTFRDKLQTSSYFPSFCSNQPQIRFWNGETAASNRELWRMSSRASSPSSVLPQSSDFQALGPLASG